MKRLTLAISLFVAAAAFAQSGGQNPTGINASLLNMFGDIKAFSSKGEVRMTDSEGKELSSLPITMSMLDGKLRTDMDLSEMKGGSMPPDAMAMLKQTGMDKMQMLITPEKKSTMLIYPGLKSYAALPISDEEMANSKVETADVGKETVDGHPCIKRKLTSTDSKGKTQEALVWAATDLKNFPLKMEMKQKKNTINIHYSAPSLEKPDAALFEVPSGYTKYDSVQGLMQAAMMKMFGGAK
jgi:hypothetical protein